MTPVTGISALFHLLVIIVYRHRKVFISLIILLGIFVLLGANLPASLRALSNDSSNLSRLVSLFDRFQTCPDVVVNPDARHIVLRLDDVQANSWKEPVVEMVVAAGERNMPMTLGLIPANLDQDPHMVSFLKNNRCGLEFALHGWDHNMELGGSVPEFGRSDSVEAYEEITRGRNVISDLLGEAPVTFIPPGNQYSAGTSAALVRAGLDIVSSEGSGSYDYDTSSYNYDKYELMPVKKVVEQCSRALDTDGLCIVMLHPQTYAIGDILDEAKFRNFTVLLDALAVLDADFVTLRDVAAPQHAAEQPTEYSAWLQCCTDTELALESMDAARGALSTILPMWYILDDTGQVFDAIAAPKAAVTEKARALGMPITPALNNELEGKRVAALLKSEARQQDAIDKLVTIGTTMGYAGWDLDLEAIPEKHRNDYTLFVQRLAERLHGANLTLSVTVHAQTGSSSDWEGVRGHDIAALAQYADMIRVMAYDYHHEESAAGAVTPLDWLEDVLRYTENRVPREKLILALPLYGYDWVKKNGEPVQYDEAISRIVSNGGSWARDAESGALTGTYAQDGVTHTVWFEDAESVVQKMDLARARGISRFSFWRLGGEDPLTWRR